MAKRPITYTSRDFSAIKQSLVEYTKRYYPDTFKDFNDASFGSLMLDTVAYIGDQLSFYLDYQTNESFLDTAVERGNINRLTRQLGYRPSGAPSSTGVVAFYILVPSNANGTGPNLDYVPILKENTLISANNSSKYLLTERIDFSDGNNEVVVARVDETTGVPTFFAVKAYGKIISGELFQETAAIGEYQRFLKVRISGENISEIISVTDSEGHEYYQVPFLSQDTVYDQIVNYGSDKEVVPYVMKAKPAPRRFVAEFDDGEVSLQFGFGSDENIIDDVIADPSDVVLERHGRTHITDESFDPTRLMKTDKFGVSPSNTTLTITYRANTTENVNAAVGAISLVAEPSVVFRDNSVTESATRAFVISSLECTNEVPVVGDVTLPSADELRLRALDNFATQNRAVTKEDYIALSYRMPERYGSVKRVNIVQDRKSLKRNLNMFVLSENSSGNLTQPTQTLKNNLKTHLSSYKMINDTVDIIDGNVVNLSVDFEIVTESGVNKYDVLTSCVDALADKFKIKKNLGEPLFLSEMFLVLNRVPGVVDTLDVKIKQKTTPGYSQFFYDIEANTSPDGRYISVNPGVAFEIKNPTQDIKGVVR